MKGSSFRYMSCDYHMTWYMTILCFSFLKMPHILRNIPHDKILSLRVQTQLYWEQYLSSIEKVIYTTLEVYNAKGQVNGWISLKSLSIGNQGTYSTYSWSFYLESFTWSTVSNIIIFN